jgi:hypothetical protein
MVAMTKIRIPLGSSRLERLAPLAGIAFVALMVTGISLLPS